MARATSICRNFVKWGMLAGIPVSICMAGGDGADNASASSDEQSVMQTITVTASRLEQTTFDSAEAIEVIGDLELRARMPRTPAEALRYKPGIWVQKTGHLGGAPVIRGFIGNRVLYLFDGVRQNTASAFAGPNANLQNIDVADVDRIEVIRGPGSVLYGSDAIGGVVNVISNEEPIFSPELRLGGRSYGRYGSADQEITGRQELRLSAPNFFVFGGITSRHIDDLHTSGGHAVESSDSREFSWDLQADLRLSPDDRVEAYVQNFSRPFGSRYDRPNWKQQNNRQLYGLRYFGEDHGLADRLRAGLYYHNQENVIDEKYWDSDGHDQSWGGELQSTTYLPYGHRLTYGLDYHQDRIRKSNPQSGTEDPRVKWYNPALFLLTQWRLSERLRLDVGVRWDYFQLTSHAPTSDRLPSAVQGAIASGSMALSDLELDERNSAFTGGVGLVYSVNDSVNWVAHVGRAFRAPNKSDMLSFGQFTQGFGVPAGALEPETSWTFETGPKVATSDFSGVLTGFYTIIKNPIVQAASTFNGANFIDVNGNNVQDPGEQVYKKQNSDDMLKVWGLEAEVAYYLPTELTSPLVSKGVFSLHGNLTWIKATATGNQELLGNANGTIPYNGYVGLRWEDARDGNARRSWVQVDIAMVDRFSDATAADLASDPAFRQDPQLSGSPLLRADGSIPGYTVVNLRLGHRLTDNATLTVTAENLTDKKYRDTYSRIDAPGFSVVSSIEICF